MSDTLYIRMLGGFSLSLGDQTIDDSNNRMRKVWLPLAYLIHMRNARISQDGLFALLQGGEDSADPAGRLKTILYRVRSMLNTLDAEAGHNWIIRRDGTYVWNKDVPVELDTDRFEQLCRQADACTDADRQLELYTQALELYRGDFLPKLAMEAWVMPLTAYYHRLYIDAVQKALDLLEARARWQEAIELCVRALQLEPYSEELYQHHIHCLLGLNDRTAALHVYEQLSEMLFSNFGVMPSDASREFYRRASSNAKSAALQASSLRELLKETDVSKGALYCEYDFFRMLYQLQARAIIRSGEIIHIALFSIRGRGGRELSQRSLNTAMDNFQDVLIHNLRQGDIVTRCSISQFIIMLPQANYENSCMVCQRLLQAFGRRYPHSPISVHYSVQPLEPVEPPKP